MKIYLFCFFVGDNVTTPLNPSSPPVAVPPTPQALTAQLNQLPLSSEILSSLVTGETNNEDPKVSIQSSSANT